MFTLEGIKRNDISKTCRIHSINEKFIETFFRKNVNGMKSLVSSTCRWEDNIKMLLC
jgi:hypothetical protein